MKLMLLIPFLAVSNAASTGDYCTPRWGPWTPPPDDEVNAYYQYDCKTGDMTYIKLTHENFVKEFGKKNDKTKKGEAGLFCWFDMDKRDQHKHQVFHGHGLP